ncbi:hypothetical protein [Gracilibacillus suaedae]|nr:hypothetical protein [Gracilibacillus suaedae]
MDQSTAIRTIALAITWVKVVNGFQPSLKKKELFINMWIITHYTPYI